MFAEPRHRKLAGRIGVEVARASVAGQLLFADLLLQRHEGVDERFGPRRAAGDVHIDGNVAVNPLKDVVALLERAAGNRADRKSTRLNSSHRCISYAVFCLKKKTAR